MQKFKPGPHFHAAYFIIYGQLYNHLRLDSIERLLNIWRNWPLLFALVSRA